MDRPVVLLTGASSGIGAATAIQLARAGAAIAMVGRSTERLEAMAAAVVREGGLSTPLRMDLGQPGAAATVAERALDAYGRLDALVNNAADIKPLTAIADALEEQWRLSMAVNLIAPLTLIRATLPALRRSSGRIVNVGSAAAHRPIIGLGAYCVAKAGLRHLTNVVALEEPHVTVVSFMPGRTDTSIHTTIRKEGASAMRADQLADYQRVKAEGELDDPSSPGRALAWLALEAPHEWSGDEIRLGDSRLPEDVRHAER